MAVPDMVESLGPNLFEAVPETRTYFGYRPFRQPDSHTFSKRSHRPGRTLVTVRSFYMLKAVHSFCCFVRRL